MYRLNIHLTYTIHIERPPKKTVFFVCIFKIQDYNGGVISLKNNMKFSPLLLAILSFVQIILLGFFAAMTDSIEAFIISFLMVACYHLMTFPFILNSTKS